MRGWLTVGLLLLVPVLSAGKDKDGDRATALKKGIAAGLGELAKWCGEQKLYAEGRGLCDEALGLEPGNAGVSALKETMAGESAADEGAKKEYEAKLATYGKKLAPLYVELSKQNHPSKDDAVHDGYLVRAYELEPKLVGPVIDAEWRGAQGKKDWERAHRLITGAERVKSDPGRAKMVKEIELKCAEKAPVLKQATGRDNYYWMVLPKGWTPAKKWPVVVYVEGAGCNFLGAIRNFADNQRSDFNCIVITPQSISSTNDLIEQKAKYSYDVGLLEKFNADTLGRLKFDEEGLLQFLADVRKEYNAEDRIYITGFSGGGNLTWRMVFGHPEKLWGAAPACPNFSNSLDLSTAPERETLPVRVFQGDKDQYIETLLEPAWVKAKGICDANGWKNVSREMIPGVGHSTCWDKVVPFFKSIPKK